VIKLWSKSFLSRLFHFSRLGFFFVVVWLIFYAICFYKQMDMFAFPHNDMFSGSKPNTDSVKFYYIQLNGKSIQITDLPYWRKDLVEQAAFQYACYYDRHQQVYLDEYLKQKKIPTDIAGHLTPGEISFKSWATWYLSHTNTKYNTGDIVQLMRVQSHLTTEVPHFSDTCLIITGKLP